MKKIWIAAVIGCLATSSCTQVAGLFEKDDDSTQTTMGDDASHAAWARDESITEANAYSDLFLDSAAVESFISKEKVADSTAQLLRGFYLSRNFQYAWFTSTGLTEQGLGVWSLTEEGSAKNQKLKERMDSLVQNDSVQVTRGDSSFVQTELMLTRSFLQEVPYQELGFTNKRQLLYMVPAKKMAPMEMADSLLNKQKDSAMFAQNKVYSQLKKQLAVYYAAAKDSSWQPLNITGRNMRKGVRSPEVTALKKRLAATGDYTGDTTNVYSDTLALAIRELQLRNGMAATGNINDSLIQILNVSPQQRVEQIVVNMNRALWMPAVKDSQHIMVNIPSLMLLAYGDTGSALQMPVIVGKEGTNTAAFTGNISQIVINPSWNVPRSIVEKEIMPKMKNDPAYLKKNNMEVVKQGDSIPQIRQLPGANNALGRMKFLFPNQYDIYLHDTPDKSAFNQSNRAISHGCIRVKDAPALARFLLNGSEDKIKTALAGNKEETIKVNKPVPVYITYYTAWVDDTGRVQFRPDIYGHDKETADRLFKRS